MTCRVNRFSASVVPPNQGLYAIWVIIDFLFYRLLETSIIVLFDLFATSKGKNVTIVIPNAIYNLRLFLLAMLLIATLY